MPVKGYDKGLICSPNGNTQQYEIGQIYEIDEAKCCHKGFHACDNPLDVLNYYNLCESEFTEVEALGEIDREQGDKDTKFATTKIKIGAKLELPTFIKASFDFLWEKCFKENDSASGDNSQLAASGYNSQLAASGYNSKLAASGDNSQLAASGDNSKLEMSGENSVGAAIGIDNKIKGVKGCWITLAEWEYNGERYIPICVKSAQIDGDILKDDTWYMLQDGEFVEVE